MGVSLIVAQSEDRIASSVAETLIARNRPVARLTRWSDAEISFGHEGDLAFSSLRMKVDGRRILLSDVSLVLYRGIPAVNRALRKRSREYAQDEWHAALSVVTSLDNCPILNSPFPQTASGRDHRTTPGGRRLAVDRVLSSPFRAPGCISNLVAPAEGGYTFSVIENGALTETVLNQAKSGFELLSMRSLRDHRVPLYWIVGGSVVLTKCLDLESSSVRNGELGTDGVRFAEECARAANLALGILWLFLDVDGQWRFGGFDRFPPQQYLGGDEMILATAICDRYGLAP
jgi:hypothetical protein